MGAIRFLAIPGALVVIVLMVLLFLKWNTKWRDRKFDAKVVEIKDKIHKETLEIIHNHALEHLSFGDPLAQIIVDEINKMDVKVVRTVAMRRKELE